MKNKGLVVAALVAGFALGSVVPLAIAGPRVGDAKFENLFLKTVQPTAEKPIGIRVQGGAEYSVVAVTQIEDDYLVVQLKSKESAYLRLRDIIAVSVPAM